MPYHLEWDAPQLMLRLRLLGDVTLSDFVHINDEITAHLAQTQGDASLALVIDMTNAKTVPQAFSALAASQKYATTKSRIRWILVISSNRLMRLMMLLTFNLCRPSLHFLDTEMDAMHFLERHMKANS